MRKLTKTDLWIHTFMWKSFAYENNSVDDCFNFEQKSFVFRVHSPDGAEYLFAAPSQEVQVEWVKKLKFHAGG